MQPYSTSVLEYNILRFPFARLCETFVGKLTDLHDDRVTRLRVGAEKTAFHTQLYAIGEPFLSLYRAFVRELLGKDGGLCLYQAIPSFRVHLPGNVATGNFHKDADFGHSEASLNFLVPLTPMRDTASVWLETEPGAADFAPVDMGVGSYLRFHGACLTHGSYPNLTGKTRVSFDFRVLPKATYKDEGKRSAQTGTPLTLGSYYADGGGL